MEENINYNQPIQPASPVGKPRKTIPTFVGIAIIVAIAAICFGGVFAWQYFAVKPQPIIQPADQFAGWKTYTNTQYGFSLSYPVDFENVDDLTVAQKNALMTYMGVCSGTKAGLCYIGSEKPNGFAAAALSVDVSTTTNMQDCQKPKSNPVPSTKATPEVIGGITFYRSKIGEAGLGHYINTNSYRTYNYGLCYTIDLSIETYRVETGPLPEGFLNTMDSKLRSVLSTFKIDQTVGWKTYTNTQYGFEVKYPANWIMDVNLFSPNINNLTGPADGVFCPLELQDSNSTNGLTGLKGGCIVGKTNGGSIDPEAPIALFQYTAQSSDCSFRGNLGIDQAGKYCYNLTLTNQKYLETYNQMISTFKFTK